jgi:hypothetical protein
MLLAGRYYVRFSLCVPHSLSCYQTQVSHVTIKIKINLSLLTHKFHALVLYNHVKWWRSIYATLDMTELKVYWAVVHICTYWNDVDINTSDTSTATHNQISGPITRSRARQLNNQVSSFLASYSSYLDNRNMFSILLLRNDGQEWNRVAFAPMTFGF